MVHNLDIIRQLVDLVRPFDGSVLEGQVLVLDAGGW